MPEGDTVHRHAVLLGRDLAGREVEHLELRDLGPVRELVGVRIEEVAALGKHLLIHFDGGWSLRVHLGMNGTWRRLGPNRRPGRHPTVLIQAGGRIWACVGAYQAELVRTRALRSHPRLARLGPDLLADPPGIDRAVARARLPAHAAREIGEALLDQRIACGIGNVFKSEVLFMARVHPCRPVGSLGEEVLDEVFRTAATLLAENVGRRVRTSVPLRRRPHAGSPRLWVYEREGLPCLDCATPIERIVQGDLARGTWLCPSCQPRDG